MLASGLVPVDAGSTRFRDRFVVLTTHEADGKRAITDVVERAWFDPSFPDLPPVVYSVEVTRGTLRVSIRWRRLPPAAVARQVRIGLGLVASLAGPDVG